MFVTSLAMQLPYLTWYVYINFVLINLINHQPPATKTPTA